MTDDRLNWQFIIDCYVLSWQSVVLLAVDYLLFLVRDVAVNPNPDEVADIRYVNQEELKELLRKADAGEEGLKLSPWFRLVVDNFLFKWWDHVQKGTLNEAIDMKTIHKLIWKMVNIYGGGLELIICVFKSRSFFF